MVVISTLCRKDDYVFHSEDYGVILKLESSRGKAHIQIPDSSLWTFSYTESLLFIKTNRIIQRRMKNFSQMYERLNVKTRNAENYRDCPPGTSKAIGKSFGQQKQVCAAGGRKSAATLENKMASHVEQ